MPSETLHVRSIDDEVLDDGHSYTPKAVFSYLTVPQVCVCISMCDIVCGESGMC